MASFFTGEGFIIICVGMLLVILVGGYLTSPFWASHTISPLFTVTQAELQRIDAELEREILARRETSHE